VKGGTGLGLARLSVLCSALLFSTGGAAIKATTLTGFEVACGRSAIAAIVLWLLLPRWRHFWRPRALLVGSAYGATMILYTLANKLTTSANAIFLQSTAPLYVLVLAPWLLSERNRRIDLGLAVVLFGGMLLFFVGGEAPAATAPNPALGNLVAISAGFTWACALVGLRWIARDGHRFDADDPLGSHDEAGAAALAGNVLVFAACLPFLVANEDVAPGGGLLSLGGLDLALLIYLGVFQVGLGYVLMTRGVAGVPALEASLLLLLEPVLNALISWWVHGEEPGGFALAGCALILSATAARTIVAYRGSPLEPQA
jgi:DME family drug/metabolite transporter